MAVAALAGLVLLSIYQQHNVTTRIERIERTTSIARDHTKIVPVPGPRGPQGDQGPKGDTGPAGPSGKSVHGPAGAQGTNGLDGVDGRDLSSDTEPATPPQVITQDDLDGLRSSLLRTLDARLLDLQEAVAQLGTTVDGVLYKINRLICPLLHC